MTSTIAGFAPWGTSGMPSDPDRGAGEPREVADGVIVVPDSTDEAEPGRAWIYRRVAGRRREVIGIVEDTGECWEFTPHEPEAVPIRVGRTLAAAKRQVGRLLAGGPTDQD